MPAVSDQRSACCFSTCLLSEARLSWLCGGAHHGPRGCGASCTGQWDVSIDVPTPDALEMSQTVPLKSLCQQEQVNSYKSKQKETRERFWLASAYSNISQFGFCFGFVLPFAFPLC